MDRVDKIIAFEQGALDDEEIIALFQEMINDGSVWSLQGAWPGSWWIGRGRHPCSQGTRSR